MIAGHDLEATVFAMEDQEEGAKLAMMTRCMERICLLSEVVASLRLKYPT
ncbi:hypothetical protein [Sulfitobacter sp.]